MNIYQHSLRAIIAVIAFTYCTFARAEYLSHVEIVDSDTHADVVIHFEKIVLFERHFPQKEAKVLFVVMRLLDPQPLTENRIFEETLRIKKTEGLPGVSATYTNDNNQLIVTFSQPTKYTVRPGEDGRSIVISLAPSKERVAKKLALSQFKIIAPVVVPPTATESNAKTLGAEKSPRALAEAPPESLSTTPSQAASEPKADPVLPTRSPAETERLAKALIEDAQRALLEKDAATAINRLNRILGFPGNGQTQAAQALVGEARAQNGETAKARAEYETYLKLYPNGSEAARVREHLAALPKGQTKARRALPTEAGPAQWTYLGSVSANYYGGRSVIDNSTLQGSNTANQSRLAAVDQKSLVTSINLNARRKDAFTDTRFVMSEVNNNDSLNSSRSYSRLYSAYVDHNDKRIGYQFRLGRQNPNGIGVFERFDGAQVGYHLNPEWRLNAVTGEAVEFRSPYKRFFYGTSIDFLPQESGVPGVSLYALKQTLNGFENRHALGTELRYFDGHINAYGTLDYDILYQGLNIALLQGSYLTDAGTNYTASYDRRRAPSFSLTNALLATPGLSLEQVIASQGNEVTRRQAKALAAISSAFSIGATHPLTPDWQVGADYRLSEISSTQPIVASIPTAVIGTCVGTIDPSNVNNCLFDTASQAASGLNHALSFQATRTNLWVTNAVGIATASFLSAPTYTGQSYSLGYVLPIGQQWRVDTNLRYYAQKDNLGATQNRISPNLKVTYQWQEKLYMEGEIGREISTNLSATQNERFQRDYFSAGMRWEFR